MSSLLIERVRAALGRRTDWFSLGDAVNDAVPTSMTLDELASEIGVSRESLRVAAWVADKIKEKNRRPELPWAYHRAAASQDDPALWLQVAVDEKRRLKSINEGRKKSERETFGVRDFAEMIKTITGSVDSH